MFKVNDLKPEWSAKVAANVANVEAKVRAKLKREWKSSGGVDRGYGRRNRRLRVSETRFVNIIHSFEQISNNLNYKKKKKKKFESSTSSLFLLKNEKIFKYTEIFEKSCQLTPFRR